MLPPTGANYGAAKGGLATFAQLVDRELNAKLAVRSYGIAPGARTRLTLSTPHAARTVGLEAPEGEWDAKSAANVAPFVIWLADANCPMPSGNVFGVSSGKVELYQPWHIIETIDGGRTWTLDELDHAVAPLLAAAPQPVRTVVEAAEPVKG